MAAAMVFLQHRTVAVKQPKITRYLLETFSENNIRIFLAGKKQERSRSGASRNRIYNKKTSGLLVSRRLEVFRNVFMNVLSHEV